MAVLLIAGGGVLAGWLALREGATEPYWVVRNEINSGEQIRAEDLTQEEYPVGHPSQLPVEGGTNPVGLYAQGDLMEGTTLVESAIGPRPRVPEGGTTIGVLMGPGDGPSSIRVGETVRVHVADPDGDSHVPEQTAIGQVIARAETDEGGLSLDVALPEECAGDISIAAADEDVTVGVVSGNRDLTCEGESGPTSATGSQ